MVAPDEDGSGGVDGVNASDTGIISCESYDGNTASEFNSQVVVPPLAKAADQAHADAPVLGAERAQMLANVVPVQPPQDTFAASSVGCVLEEEEDWC